MPKAAVLALVVGIGAWTTSFSVAGFQDPRQTPVFKTGTDLVHFDVSVLDKDRHPVRGLTAADFTILEDGKTAEGTIPAERFDLIQRAADHSFAIPISELGPGRYLLSFDLSLREAVFRRDVVVTVR